MTLYAQYIKERGNKHIVENEWGFATYSAYKDGMCIEDIYVVPGLRKGGIAKEFHDQIVEKVKEMGFKKIYNCVAPSVNQNTQTNPTGMVKWMFSQGYSLDECFNGVLILSKDI